MVTAALLFALVHVRDLRLAAGTLLLATALTPIWLRWRNVWPLGVCHGWLGGAYYHFVLGRDPWLELVGP